MDKALQTMIDNMPEKKGTSLHEWKKIHHAKKFAKCTEAIMFLKEIHRVTQGIANTIVALSKAENETLDRPRIKTNGKTCERAAPKLRVFWNHVSPSGTIDR